MNEIVVSHVEPAYPFNAYAHVVEPLTEEDGGGYLITFPIFRVHVRWRNRGGSTCQCA